jgi:phosphohistidine swiveling domain-containing protein
MSWRLLVTRKDSPIRMFNVAMQRSTTDLNFVGSPHLRAARFDKFIIDHHGAYHVDADQMMGLMIALINTSRENPGYFAKVAQRYLKLGADLLSWLGETNRQSLKELSDQQLLELFDRFCGLYVDYAPILFVPFAVERRYTTEYPALLRKIAGQIKERWTSELNGNQLLGFVARDLLDIELGEEHLIKRINATLEHSVRRTMTEEKEVALLQAAARITENHRIADLFARDQVPSLETIFGISPSIADQINSIVDKHAWIKQWGYPPFYTASSVEDILSEINDKLANATGALANLQEDEEHAKRNYALLLDSLTLDQQEKELLEDLNLYNFLRTYRMEVKIKAQFLSVRLLREIERRAVASGKLKKDDDIFFLTPPEIREVIITGLVPSNYEDRRDGWVLIVNGKDYKMLSGIEYQKFQDGFYGVIDCRENARSINSVDQKYVGGKAKNLFTLLEHGFNVPKFFVVTTHAYRNFVNDNKLDVQILAILAEHRLSQVGEEQPVDYEAISNQIGHLFASATFPEGVRESIRECFNSLALSEVAVRSSATTEDAENLSWAGRFKSLIYVKQDGLIDAIKEIWASLLSPAALQYAFANGIDPSTMQMAVVIQEMIDPDVSGVVNTTLSTKNADLMEIEAAFGQGTPIVSGEITPDRFIISKNLSTFVDRVIGRQIAQLGRDGWSSLEIGKQSKQKLDDRLLLDLARVCLDIETLFEKPQDIEYAYAGNQLFVLQSRSETGLQALEVEHSDVTPVDGHLILSGQHGKVEGVVRARAKVLSTPTESGKMGRGEILVLHAATPAWDSIIFKSAGIICNEGGSTSHAIRVSNERKIPAVVGTGNATDVVKDGDLLVIDTRDSFKGRVYRVMEAK